MAGMTNWARTVRAFAANPPELLSRMGFNGLAQISPVIVTLAITPLLLDRLGLDRYGIWSLALVILGTLTLLDGGIAASLARFFAINAAQQDRADSGRLLLAAMCFFVLLGGVLTLAVYPLAPEIVGLLDIPASLEDEAVVVIRLLPAVAALALLADSTAALLQGNGQFRALAGSMFISTGAFAVAVVLLVQPGAHLRVLMFATAIRYAALVAVSILFAGRNVSIGRPFFPSRETFAELWRYASRMQLSALTGFVNSQLDAIVIAAALPVRYVGLYNIGLQAASAVRSLPLYAFAPILTRMTMIFRREGREAAAADFQRLERRWTPAVLGYGVVAVGAIGFSVPIWLGDRYALSGIVATLLLACYMIHVGLTGVRTCYVRAVGRPGLETRYSLVWTIGNSLLTVPLAIVGGVVGVVSATAVTGVVASVYFVVLCRRSEGLQMTMPDRRWWNLAAAALAITVAGELAILRTDFHGFLALALTGLPAFAALAVFAAGVRRVRGVSLASS
jgi:O-antigen/teichoic acid export membrane protein